MYRIFVLTIICMACNASGKKEQQPASGELMSFLKNEVNPLLQNQEPTAARKKLDSILPVIKKRDNYVEMCSWLRCMAVVYQLENKLSIDRYNWPLRKIQPKGKYWRVQSKRLLY